MKQMQMTMAVVWLLYKKRNENEVTKETKKQRRSKSTTRMRGCYRKRRDEKRRKEGI